MVENSLRPSGFEKPLAFGKFRTLSSSMGKRAPTCASSLGTETRQISTDLALSGKKRRASLFVDVGLERRVVSKTNLLFVVTTD